MNTSKRLFFFLIIGIITGTHISGVYGDEDGFADINLSANNTSAVAAFQSDFIDPNLTANSSAVQNVTEQYPDPAEETMIYSGVLHPNEETDIKSSTPEGNPFIPGFAQGGVTVDFMGHLMEARGDGSNVSSEISFHDHTGVNGNIRTLVKDFHYMSGVDTESG